MSGTRRTGRSGAMQIEWCAAWSEDLDTALETIPESPMCPRPLYRALLRSNCSPSFPVALVGRHGEPSAVIGLHRTGHLKYEVRTNWLIPGFVCAASDRDVLPALEALHRRIDVAFWRTDVPVPFERARNVVTTPVHRLAVDDRERFWRSSKQWQNVTAARRKCGDLELGVDAPGDAEWVIRNWASKWVGGGDPTALVDDRVVVAQHLTQAGLQLTLTLRRDGVLVAGTTNFVHGDTITAGVLYRDDSLGSLPTGVRLIDALFDLAAERGFRSVDLGGGHDYKSKWAPATGEHHLVTFAPRWDGPARSAMRTAGRVARSGRRQLRRLTPDGSKR